MDPLDFLRVLLDPARLAVVGVVAGAPRTADELVSATRASRRDVLATLAQLVQAGVFFGMTNEERDVLARYHPDYAALRRYLVDEGFLDRREGLYWRSGGRVD